MTKPTKPNDRLSDKSLLARFPALRTLSPSKRRKLPFIQQLAITECGAACLTMLLHHYGKELSLDEVRAACGVARDGVSALSILHAARLYGLRGRGVALKNPTDLQFLPQGAILHWEFNHFVVFVRQAKQFIEILDPAVGRRRITREEFSRAFTGIALLIEPSEAFVP